MMRFIACLLPCCFAGHLAAQDNLPEIDPIGGVLCTYAISLYLETTRAQCQPQNKVAQDLLSDSIARHRAFVLRNSETSAADLDVFESENGDLNGQSCDALESNDIVPMLDFLTKNSTEWRSEIDEILAVDRKPVWNPCL